MDKIHIPYCRTGCFIYAGSGFCRVAAGHVRILFSWARGSAASGRLGNIDRRSAGRIYFLSETYLFSKYLYLGNQPQCQYDWGLDPAKISSRGNVMGNNLLELTGVSAELQRKRIIDTINLAVPKRSRVSIIGTSGCGKSTLLKLIAGLLRAPAWQVTGQALSLIHI